MFPVITFRKNKVTSLPQTWYCSYQHSFETVDAGNLRTSDWISSYTNRVKNEVLHRGKEKINILITCNETKKGLQDGSDLADERPSNHAIEVKTKGIIKPIKIHNKLIYKLKKKKTY
jgi:hypothetical protein